MQATIRARPADVMSTVRMAVNDNSNILYSIFSINKLGPTTGLIRPRGNGVKHPEGDVSVTLEPIFHVVPPNRLPRFVTTTEDKPSSKVSIITECYPDLISFLILISASLQLVWLFVLSGRLQRCHFFLGQVL